MSEQHWLVKSEPEEYSISDLKREGVGCWDGVRNVEARNNLRAMKEGDNVLFYHSGKERGVVGLARVVKEAYRDPTSTRAIWSAVDVEYVRHLTNPVTLKTIKQHGAFSESALVRRSRLSVMPLTEEHYRLLLELSESAE